MNSYDTANNLDFFNECLDQLIAERFLLSLGETPRTEISRSEMRKSAWVASYLANSDDSEHKQKSLNFSVLSYLRERDSEYEDIHLEYLYVILSRLGSTPVAEATVANISGQSEQPLVSSGMLQSELNLKREFFRLNDETVLTSFQYDIWNHLDSQYFVFSGPTSSGKSRILKEYMKHLSNVKPAFQAVYIVPTRALISEVSTEFRSVLEDVKVQTGVYFDQSDPEEQIDEDEKFLFVLTPERCLNLLDERAKDRLDLDLIFVDEIQNLESNSRGALFENVLENLYELWPNSQYLGAGPYISNPAEVFSDALGVEADDIETSFTPVVHLQGRFQIGKGAKNIEVEVRSPTGNTLNRSIDRPTGLAYSSTKKDTYGELVRNYGLDDQLVLYSSTRKNAENAAAAVYDRREKTLDNSRISELCEFLEDSIHSEYSLIEYLKKGVGFHHGRVPEVARHEIESLYRKEVISVLTCTPTLLEGVNLPAEKMFIIDPKKGRSGELTDFEFQNLTGRVGRVGSKLFGTVVYVDQSEEEWTSDRLESQTEKEVVSATKSTLNDDIDDVIENVGSSNSSDLEDKALRYTITILRNKYLKDDHDTEKYLRDKGVSEEDTLEVTENLRESLDSIEVPESVLRQNPTVDPVLQDVLFKQVKSNTSSWEIQPSTLREDFFSVVKSLNSIFQFVADSEEGVTVDRFDGEVESRNINELKWVAYHWLSGKRYREIINYQKKYYDSDENIDRVIDDVIAIVNQDTRFILERYFKILCDILTKIDNYENQFMLNFDKRLERGVIDSDVLELIDMGIDRSIAIDLDIPSNSDPVEYLKKTYSGRSGLYQRHMRNQGIL